MSVAISIQGVSKTFGHTCALNKIDLDIVQGEIFGLLGPNGAGKTTLISAIAGLVRPDSGTISVMNHDVQRHYRNARQCLGVVPQELVFDPFFSVREALRLQSGYFGLSSNDEWIDHLLRKLDLSNKADANMRTLSGGMKRRVLVAQALVHRPPVIILDEPTAGVDVELRQTLWQFISQLNGDGHTIVLTTHYLDEAQSLCGRIGMLKGGQLVALDSTDNLLSQHSTHVLKLKCDRPPPVSLKAQPLDASGAWGIPFAANSEIESILATCRVAGCVIEDIEVGKPDLEAVFVQIMHSSKVS